MKKHLPPLFFLSFAKNRPKRPYTTSLIVPLGLWKKSQATFWLLFMYILGVATLLLLLQAMHSVLKLYVSSSIKMKGEMSRHRPKYKVKLVLPLFQIQTIILTFWKIFFGPLLLGVWAGGVSVAPRSGIFRGDFLIQGGI